MQKGAAGNRFCREVGHSVYLCQEKAIEADKGSEREKKMEKECPFILPRKAIKFEKFR
jgi:hypothetical protein